jgi:hypothetical protein
VPNEHVSDALQIEAITALVRDAALSCFSAQNGLVGINSEVSYRLDHAPAVKKEGLISVPLCFSLLQSFPGR